MPDGYEHAYALAKSQALFQGFNLGDRLRHRCGLRNLHELYRETLGHLPPPLPEYELLERFERMTRKRAFAMILSSCAGFREFPRIVKALLARFDLAALKQGLSCLRNGTEFKPETYPVRTVDFSVWPDVAKATSGTPFSWLGKEYRSLSAFEVETRLDRSYYAALYHEALALKGEGAETIRNLVKLECELQNVAWAFRLKNGYSVPLDEIEPGLVSLAGCDVVSSPLLGVALERSDRESFTRWRWYSALCAGTEDASGRVRPEALERKAISFLFSRYRHAFRVDLFTYVTVFCFARLAVFEADALRSCAEGVRLAMPPGEIEACLGAAAC